MEMKKRQSQLKASLSLHLSPGCLSSCFFFLLEYSPVCAPLPPRCAGDEQATQFRWLVARNENEALSCPARVFSSFLSEKRSSTALLFWLAKSLKI